jgi:hypothetical protein
MGTPIDVVDLARRVKELERLLGVTPKPVEHFPAPNLTDMWPPTPSPNKTFFPQVKPQPACGKCGMLLTDVMGYVCGAPDCPTGLGGVTISTTGVLNAR